MYEINNIFRVLEYCHWVQTPFIMLIILFVFFPSEGLRLRLSHVLLSQKRIVFSITVLLDNTPPGNLKDHSKTAYFLLSDSISFF